MAPAVAERLNKLPAHPQRLIGRDDAVVATRQLLLEGVRGIVTLTGAGGCGKTLLAVHVAADLGQHFADGVSMVELAPLADAELVPATVAAAFGVVEKPGQPAVETLLEYLRPRQLLLVLDNCEHLIDACAQLAERLLSTCPRVRLLTTSREPLRVSGEVTWRVPSLGVPTTTDHISPDELLRYPAAQLFVERARAVRASFVVTPESARVIAQICARLDGLPLALELAAARLRMLSPQQILDRLDDTFRLLVGGSRTAHARQRTLRATLDWSFELLTETEQLVFRRLAVFAGDWSLDAGEHVCADAEGTGALDVLGSLVDKSLVIMDERDGHARFRLLEPIRQYALERLVASGELETAQRRHALFFLNFAEGWEPELRLGGTSRPVVLDALERENQNLRAALRWCASAEPQLGLRLANAIALLWVFRSYDGEGLTWLRTFLATPGTTERDRVMAQAWAIQLAARQGDPTAARALTDEALARVRATSDPYIIHNVLQSAAIDALQRAEYATATSYLEEALAMNRVAGDSKHLCEATCLANLGWAACLQGSYAEACALGEEAVALTRAADDTVGMGIALSALGQSVLHLGDLPRARQLIEESLTVRRVAGARFGVAHSLGLLGQVAHAQGRLEEARANLVDSVQRHHDVGDRFELAASLEALAALAATQAQPQHALHLAGAAAALREAVGNPLSPMDRMGLERWFIPVQQATGGVDVATAWTTGRAMSVDAAVALAATGPPLGSHKTRTKGERASLLSMREHAVMELVARGCTNRQIAAELTLSGRTVEWHVANILGKLGLDSRSQVAAWAAMQRLTASTSAGQPARAE
jgi:predicted ATPase/DNA-binding CsgD family transcriptional regulator